LQKARIERRYFDPAHTVPSHSNRHCQPGPSALPAWPIRWLCRAWPRFLTRRVVDFLNLHVELKVTSVRQPQSSCPLRHAKPKVLQTYVC